MGHVGFICRMSRVGPMLASLGWILGPGRRLMGRGWVHIDVFWAYVELMLGVAGPKLARLALSWWQVGQMLAYVG